MGKRIQLKHDVVFAFLVLVGLILVVVSFQGAWLERSGESNLRELLPNEEMRGEMEALNEWGQEFILKAYSETVGLDSLRWSYTGGIKILYVAIATLLAGFVSLCYGFGLVNPTWRAILILVSIPIVMSIFFSAKEAINGASFQAGALYYLGGVTCIGIGTIMMKPAKPEPVDIGDENRADSHT